jgi:ParB family transcriptional regulator, chromosome partitioning protein
MFPQEAIQYIPLDRITTVRQVREDFDEAALRGLAASLTAIGQLQPIRVRTSGDKFIVVDGERRLRAAKKASLAMLACIVEPTDLCEGEILHKQLVSDCQREQLSAVERAQAIDRLMRTTGWTATETASRLGLSPASVAKYLAILRLPDAIRGRVADGSIPASAAYELARIDDPARQAELAKQMTDGRLTRDGLAGARKRGRENAPAASATKATRVTLALNRGQSVTLVAENLTQERCVEILEEVLGKARRARTQGLEIWTFANMLRDQTRLG